MPERVLQPAPVSTTRRRAPRKISTSARNSALCIGSLPTITEWRKGGDAVQRFVLLGAPCLSAVRRRLAAIDPPAMWTDRTPRKFRAALRGAGRGSRLPRRGAVQ
jgi:hypothetical protein